MSLQAAGTHYMVWGHSPSKSTPMHYIQHLASVTANHLINTYLKFINKLVSILCHLSVWIVSHPGHSKTISLV